MRVLFPLALFCMSVISSACASDPGLAQRVLRPCPGSPNCVTSEAPGRDISPFMFTDTPDTAWIRLREAIQNLGGEVTDDAHGYLHAVFRSRLFGFVDDLECRMDAQARVIHVRSASRAGYWDFGVNKRRVESLREAWGKLNPLGSAG